MLIFTSVAHGFDLARQQRLCFGPTRSVVDRSLVREEKMHRCLAQSRTLLGEVYLFHAGLTCKHDTITHRYAERCASQNEANPLQRSSTCLWPGLLEKTVGTIFFFVPPHQSQPIRHQLKVPPAKRPADDIHVMPRLVFVADLHRAPPHLYSAASGHPGSASSTPQIPARLGGTHALSI